jgi:hypothetical protein
MALYRSDVVGRIHHGPYPRSLARRSEEARVEWGKLANVHVFVLAVMGERRSPKVEELLGQLIAAEFIHV